MSPLEKYAAKQTLIEKLASLPRFIQMLMKAGPGNPAARQTLGRIMSKAPSVRRGVVGKELGRTVASDIKRSGLANVIQRGKPMPSLPSTAGQLARRSNAPWSNLPVPDRKLSMNMGRTWGETAMVSPKARRLAGLGRKFRQTTPLHQRIATGRRLDAPFSPRNTMQRHRMIKNVLDNIGAV